MPTTDSGPTPGTDAPAGVDAPALPYDGLGERCAVDSIPACGFHETGNYYEVSLDCEGRRCLVFELDGHPDNRMSAGCPRDTTNPECATADDPTTCIDDVDVHLPEEPPADSIERMFCTCVCDPAALEDRERLCVCGAGYSCSTYGVCLPERMDPAFCDRADDPHCPGRCNLTTRRCT